jgi:iron complex outermembrane receptor protein
VALSDADRLATRTEQGIRMVLYTIPGAVPGTDPVTQLLLVGNPDMKNEDLQAAEIGLRWEPRPSWMASISCFSNRYRQLRGIIPGTPEGMASPEAPFYYISAPFYTANLGDATLYGGEAWFAWQPNPAIKLRPSVSRCLETFRFENEDENTIDQGQSPAWQVALRGNFDLPGNLELDANYRYVDHLPALSIPAYQTVDIRVGWHIRPDLELSVVGRNLLKKDYPEFNFNVTAMPSSEIERAVSARLTWGW